MISETLKGIKLTPLTEEDEYVRGRGVFITIDKYKRMNLSSKAVELFHKKDTKFRIYISYNIDRKIIAIVNAEVDRPVGCVQRSVDKRGYTSARGIVAKFNLPLDNAPFHFEYIGNIDDDGVRWYAFQMKE